MPISNLREHFKKPAPPMELRARIIALIHAQQRKFNMMIALLEKLKTFLLLTWKFDKWEPKKKEQELLYLWREYGGGPGRRQEQYRIRARARSEQKCIEAWLKRNNLTEEDLVECATKKTGSTSPGPCALLSKLTCRL